MASRRLLHIDSSSRTDGSVSRRLSTRFIEELQARGLNVETDRLDLALTPPEPLNEIATAAMYLEPDERSDEMRVALARSDAFVDRVLAADLIVAAMPMYNFGMPALFKLFIDNIVRSGRTFEMTDSGVNGLLAGKRAAFILATGGDYRPGGAFEGLDCLTPHLRAIFGFLGLPGVDIVHAQPLQFSGPGEKASAIDRAERDVVRLADQWRRELTA